jgi:c-di-GMP-binding flagellar brake protein YcgR
MTVDRRNSMRVTLHLAVFLFSESKDPVRTETINISSSGFYCTSNEPFAVGSRLRCVIVLPGQAHATPQDVLFLDCKAEVMRVVANAAQGFGTGFRILQYRVITSRTGAEVPPPSETDLY